MPDLQWTGRGKASVAGHGIVTRGESITVDDATADRLLAHHSDGWSYTESATTDAETAADSDDSSDSDDADTDTGADDESPAYDTYPRDELEAMDWSHLRDLASESDADAIDGRSNKDKIIETLAEE